MKTKAEDVKKYFSEVFVMENRIHKLCEKIEIARSKQISGGGLGGSLGVQKNRNYRYTEDLSVAILELEGDMAKMKTSLLRREMEIREIACGLQDPMRRAIITWRYICRLIWKDIAVRAQMTEMQVIREHNAAVKDMAMAKSKIS